MYKELKTVCLEVEIMSLKARLKAASGFITNAAVRVERILLVAQIETLTKAHKKITKKSKKALYEQYIYAAKIDIQTYVLNHPGCFIKDALKNIPGLRCKSVAEAGSDHDIPWGKIKAQAFAEMVVDNELYYRPLKPVHILRK